MKPTTLAIIGLSVIGLLVGIIAARADDAGTTLVWDPNDPADKVGEYIVAFRPRGNATNVTAWSEVVVKASPAPTVVLPVSPFAQRQRNRLRRDSILCGELWFGRFSPQRLRMGNTPR